MATRKRNERTNLIEDVRDEMYSRKGELHRRGQVAKGQA